MKRDFIIVILLILALALTACAGKEKAIDWTHLASEAVPRFGQDDCGQTLIWDKELGRWKAAKGRDVVVEGQVVIRLDCKGADNE